MTEEMPTRFGKCVVTKRLGRGATAHVYLATHEGLGIRVAVKVLRRELSEKRPRYAERFLREARTAAWLEHPNIVRVIDCGIQDGLHYMVMDYADGPNCLQMLRNNPRGLDWREATGIIRQVATGLAYAAEHDVIHRDIKPSNIIVDQDGRARITDLGLAKLTIKGLTDLTQELHTVGTPNYMSPEQIRSSQKLDLRSDIYSLGASFYHMVVGQTPYSGKNPMEVVAKHLTAQLAPPLERKPDLPASLSSTICKMMAKAPADRYQDYETLREDLQNLLAGKTTTAEGFRDVQLTDDEQEELRRALEQLQLKAELDEEEPAPAPEPAPPLLTESQIRTFDAGEFDAYKPPEPEYNQAELKRRGIAWEQRVMGLLWTLVALGVLALVVVLLVAFLYSNR